jgi:hypothetical protein
MLLLFRNHLTHSTRWIFLSIVSLCLLLPRLPQAAEWSLKGNVKQSLGYDDNVRMLTTNPEGSFKYMIVPVLTFARRTDNTEIKANASYGTQVYTDIPGFNQDIQNYSIQGTYNADRFIWGLSSSYSITPSRNTATQDSGDFNNNSDRTTWTVSPSVSYRIDELNSLILTPSYSETTFTGGSNSTNTNFSNYTSINVNLGWKRLWTERYKSTVSAFYTNYQPSQASSTIGNNTQSQFDSVGLNFSNNYDLSENWQLMGTIGGRHTESTRNGISNTSLGFLADAGINYIGENFGSGIHFSRSLQPSNQGQLQEQTSASLNFNYKILERLSASFTTSWQESTLVSTTNSPTRTNIVLEPVIRWQLAPEWTLSGSYRYRTQDRGVQINNTGDITAESNLFQISINYNWQGLSLSR